MDKVVLRCKEGAFTLTRSLPTGGQYVVKFTKEANFEAEVPVRLEYSHPFENKTTVADERFAQGLLDKYACLELVEIKKEPVVVQPTVVDKRKKKKEKEHEENSV